MRIGLPRALMYHYYYPLWEKLFCELGAQVVLSDVTGSEMLEKGIKITVSELCVPIKIFNAHLINLLEKGVDYCFVPRFVSIDGEKEWFCPKFLGLPDLARYSVPGLTDKLLTVTIQGKREDTCEIKNYMPLCSALSVTKGQLKKALKVGKEYFYEYRALCKQGYTIDQAQAILTGHLKPDENKEKPKISIGVMGYVYNIYDRFVSMDIINRLRKSGIGIVTFDMMDEKVLENKKDRSKPLFWLFSRKVYNGSKELILNGQVDGIIHVTAFACGPDSVIGKMLEIDCEKSNMPFMTIRVDEHTGENHIQTRIEAFCDMLIRKKEARA